MIDATDADATVDNSMEDDGYTGEDDEPTNEVPELDAGEAGAAELDQLDCNNSD